MGRKFTKEEIEKALNRYGYILNEDDYHGIREKYHLIDKDGYKYFTRLDNLLVSNRIPEKFSPLNPYTLENLQNYLHLIGSKQK